METYDTESVQHSLMDETDLQATTVMMTSHKTLEIYVFEVVDDESSLCRSILGWMVSSANCLGIDTFFPVGLPYQYPSSTFTFDLSWPKKGLSYLNSKLFHQFIY
ncbi:uncharacterized protein ASCRUDRAFT_78241 [Ascoidea rubescens DSM 1968]|uniref:Uncharacterized protein n=1 Tax=Ascoidea rubescens DSM 1968 TaxID=1344418 RepID=A0A1D2V8T3_9ASCO|nr:hypothetical protein ASCRUDRAFT_78241 [Ascoidea rubescens DSM 1968]ODV58009.1 hypothetical protein ASCRUDRAFT_78241 [Ascoidea rubescens DSM 1968]